MPVIARTLSEVEGAVAISWYNRIKPQHESRENAPTSYRFRPIVLYDTPYREIATPLTGLAMTYEGGSS